MTTGYQNPILASGASLASRNIAWFILIALWIAAPISYANSQTPNASAQTASTKLLLPSGISADTQGNLYIAESNRHDILKVDPAGFATVIAGTGTQGFSGDNGPAISAQLDSPTGVAISPDGSIYIADTHNQRIRRILNGNIATIAGTGVKGFIGDNGSPLSAALDNPTALTVDSSGTLYIADTGNHRIRRIANNIIVTIAGNTTQGFSGDGGPAVAASLDTPDGIAIDPAGRLYIADTHNQRLRMVDINGIIQTIAGNGNATFSGENVVATQAALAYPRGLTIDQSGNVLFADSSNNRIRIVSPSGVISTIIGDGIQGFTADGATVTQASLNSPLAVAVTSSGSIAVTDSANGLIRETAGGDLYTVSGAGIATRTSIALSSPSSTTYGSGSAIVSLTAANGLVTGTLTLQVDNIIFSSASVTGTQATLDLSSLFAGVHSIAVLYSGDVLHSSAISNTVAITVAPKIIAANISTFSASYGSPTPALTGALSGLLPSDIANLSLNLSTSAVQSSPVGIYAIFASLNGAAAANYALAALPSSAVLVISPAPTVSTLLSSSTVAYVSQPIRLTAMISPSATGIPTGTVTFFDAGSAISTLALSGATASLPTAFTIGSHTLTATYSGDSNFLPSASARLTQAVLIIPDFIVSPAGSSTLAVSAGSSAAFNFIVQSMTGVFPSAVAFTAAGLPAGSSATFTPAQVIPGSSSVNVIMTVHTSGIASRFDDTEWFPISIAVLFVPLIRRKLAGGWITAAVLSFAMLSITGCGTRTVTGTASSTYSITVTATATSVIGTPIQHAALVSLTID